MNCKRARTDIALSVGKDLDDAAEQEVRRHVAGCPHCRDHAKDLETNLQYLQQLDDEESIDRHRSLWPALASRLAALDDARHLERFNGWVPALTVAAACLMIVLLLDTPRPQEDQMLQPQTSSSMISYPIVEPPVRERYEVDAYPAVDGHLLQYNDAERRAELPRSFVRPDGTLRLDALLQSR